MFDNGVWCVERCEVVWEFEEVYLLLGECGIFGVCGVEKWRMLDEKKIKATMDWLRLTLIRDVRNFHGLT